MLPTSLVSIVMLASKPHVMMQQVKAISAIVPDYREFLIGVSPGLSSDERLLLEQIPRVRLLSGAATTDEAGPARFNLLDHAQGEWIVNCDDDDLWYQLPVANPRELAALDPEVGLLTGSTLILRLFADMASDDSYIFKGGRPIREPHEAYNLGGSFWMVRKQAWNSISSYIDRAWWFSDWRMTYALLHAGWKVHSARQLLGVVRTFSWNYPSGPEWDWKQFHERLAQSLPQRRDKPEDKYLAAHRPLASPSRNALELGTNPAADPAYRDGHD